ncbi:hypothetical protein EC968_000413, partial [Mortierella alpina]
MFECESQAQAKAQMTTLAALRFSMEQAQQRMIRSRTLPDVPYNNLGNHREPGTPNVGMLPPAHTVSVTFATESTKARRI